MEGENRIVEFWIKNQGYSIVNNLNAGKNKLITILAFKNQKSMIIKHIEVFVSLSENINIEEISKKFQKPEIKRAIKQHLKKMGFKSKSNQSIEPLLITNRSAIVSSDSKPFNVPIYYFEDVLKSVFEDLDQMNYPDNNLRILQIMKFIVLNQKDLTSKIIDKVSSKKTKEEILTKLLQSNETLPFFSKKTNLKILENLFSNSILSNPTILANYLPQNYSSRKLNTFIKTLFENKALKGFTKKRMPQQKPLTVFLE